MADAIKQDVDNIDTVSKFVEAIKNGDQEKLWDLQTDTGLDLLGEAIPGVGHARKLWDAGARVTGLPSATSVVNHTNPAYLMDHYARPALTEAITGDIARGQTLAAHPEMLPRGMQDMLGVPEAQQTSGVRSVGDMIDAIHGRGPGAPRAAGPHAPVGGRALYDQMF
jgi:hypothetical protein